MNLYVKLIYLSFLRYNIDAAKKNILIGWIWRVLEVSIFFGSSFLPNPVWLQCVQLCWVICSLGINRFSVVWWNVWELKGSGKADWADQNTLSLMGLDREGVALRLISSEGLVHNSVFSNLKIHFKLLKFTFWFPIWDIFRPLCHGWGGAESLVLSKLCIAGETLRFQF